MSTRASIRLLEMQRYVRLSEEYLEADGLKTPEREDGHPHRSGAAVFSWPWSSGDRQTVPGLTLTESGQPTSYRYRYWGRSGKSY